MNERVYCSFCGRHNDEPGVTTVVKGEEAAICDLCVDLAHAACADQRSLRANLTVLKCIRDDAERKAWEGTGP